MTDFAGCAVRTKMAIVGKRPICLVFIQNGVSVLSGVGWRKEGNQGGQKGLEEGNIKRHATLKKNFRTHLFQEKSVLECEV